MLTGQGGVGKTALALHWAHAMRARFPNGELHADPSAFSGSEPLPLPGQGDGLDEVQCQDRLGLGAQEHGPGDGRSVWRRVDAGSFEDLPHGRRRDLDTEKCEFSVDAPIAPRGVLGCQTQDKAADRRQVNMTYRVKSKT